MNRPARGLGTALIVLMGLATVVGLPVAGLQWGIAPILFGAAMGDRTSLVLVVLFTTLGAASGLLHLAAWITLSAVALASAAVLATRVIRQIEARQNAPVTESSASPAPAA